ncbi:hypothetical protein Lal_00002561 [Lupinus albus]|nr:hypothetical protein Lal_00002561 [Lupinus albus]
MASARAAGAEAYRELNRAFGSLLEEAQAAPQVVIAVLEGAVLGGGFGLACISDIAIAHQGAQFGLPETGLGILPAQIAPFVVKRIGLTQARRLALTAARFDGNEALRLGLVHFAEADDAAVDARLGATLEQVRRCAPGANARTKALLLATEERELGPLLDDAAQWFADAVTGAEGAEGTMAFVQKRKPTWAQRIDPTRSPRNTEAPRRVDVALHIHRNTERTQPGPRTPSGPQQEHEDARIQQDPDRQPGRDRLPGDAHRASARLPHRGGVQRSRPRRPPRAARRRGGVHRPGPGGAVLPQGRGDHRRRPAHRRRRRAPRLRLPFRERRVRPRLRGRRHRLHRPQRRSHPPDGQQAPVEDRHARSRRALHPRLRGCRAGRRDPRPRGRAHRLPADDQGQRRWRRSRHAPGARSRRAGRADPHRALRSAERLRLRRADPRTRGVPPAPRGDPGVRRPAGYPPLPGRARLLGAAPPPEGGGGSPLSGDDPGTAPCHGRGRGQGRSLGQLHRRRHRGIPPRRRGPLLLPGNEHPPAGGAPGHRAGHRARPGGLADPGRRRPAAAPGPERHPPRWPRHGGAPVRRGPGQQLPPADRRRAALGACPPAGIRIDHGLVEGQPVTPFYDPMLAKVIAWGATRDEARRKLVRAVEDCVLLGVKGNQRFLANLLAHPEFAAGHATTAFIGEHFANDPSLAPQRRQRALALRPAPGRTEAGGGAGSRSQRPATAPAGPYRRTGHRPAPARQRWPLGHPGAGRYSPPPGLPPGRPAPVAAWAAGQRRTAGHHPRTRRRPGRRRLRHRQGPHGRRHRRRPRGRRRSRRQGPTAGGAGSDEDGTPAQGGGGRHRPPSPGHRRRPGQEPPGVGGSGRAA